MRCKDGHFTKMGKLNQLYRAAPKNIDNLSKIELPVKDSLRVRGKYRNRPMTAG